MIGPAESEGSENNRAHENGHRKGKGKGRGVKFKEAFPTQEVYRGDLKKDKPHMNVPSGWAVLGWGAAKGLARAELVAMLAQVCEKRGHQGGDDRMVEAVS